MSSRFQFIETGLVGLSVIKRNPVSDHRGIFERIYCADEYKLAGLANKSIVQINRSVTKQKHAVRGLHFQHPPHMEDKIITCVKGEVLDIAVDIRQGSDSFLQWHSEVLSADDYKSLYIPAGFAHGFQTLSDDCELLYFHTAAYEPSAEGALNIQDPRINISLAASISDISEKDKNSPLIDENFEGIAVS